ncbi:MAG: autotransporter outer membrane beta-barrel domain-containing protein [Pseudomonadota bacterium]
MIKWKGNAASCAPGLAGAIGGVLAVLLSTTSALHAGPEPCTVSGNMVTCSGDQSDGITTEGGGADIDIAVTNTVNINGLTSTISPTGGEGLEGVDGIRIKANSPETITVVSDVEPFGIAATGQYATGVFFANQGGGDISLTHDGDISTTGGYGRAVSITTTGDMHVVANGAIQTQGRYASGVWARNSQGGKLNVATSGTITTSGKESLGIEIEARQNADVTVNSSSVITTSGEASRGISAYVDTGTIDIVSHSNIMTAGDQSSAIHADADRTADITVTSYGNLDTTGRGSPAIRAGASGDVSVTSDGQITTQGDSSNGISTLGGSIAVSAGGITTNGEFSPGLVADGDEISVISNDLIKTSGDFSNGIAGLAYDSLSIRTEAPITTSGDRSSGVFGGMHGEDGSITTNGTISTSGLFSDGVIVRLRDGSDGKITTHGGISTTGDRSHGIYATGAGSISITNNGPITTTGQGSSGIFADISGTGTVVKTTADVNAEQGTGIFAFGRREATEVTVTGSSISGLTGLFAGSALGTVEVTLEEGAQVIGTEAEGVIIIGPSDDLSRSVLTVGDDVRISGKTAAILNGEFNSQITVAGTASLIGGVQLNGGSDSLTFNGGNFGATGLIDGGDDNSRDDGFIDKLTLNGVTGALTGANLTGWEEIDLVNGSVISFTDSALSAGRLLLDAGSRLSFRNGTASDRFALTGDFAGGGIVEVDVDFATGTSDRLLIDGDVVGESTRLAVVDVSSGEAIGRAVVLAQVTGDAAADAFTLDTPVVSGAFTYELAQFGSDFVLSADVALREEIASIEAFGQTLLQVNAVPTLSQRTQARQNTGSPGVTRNSLSFGSDLGGSSASLPTWLQIEGGKSKFAPRTSAASFTATLSEFRVRGGIDVAAFDFGNGQMVIGASAFYGTSQADIVSASGNGSVDTKAYGFGLSATWWGMQGLYTDAQFQYSVFDSTIASGGTASTVKGDGILLSAEVGQRFPLDQSNWSVTPQAQLTYSTVDYDDFNSGAGLRTSVNKADSLRLRLGVTLDNEQSWTDARGNAQQLSLSTFANVYNEFKGESVIDVSGTRITNKAEPRSVEVGFGVTRNFDDNRASLFARGSAAVALGNGSDNYSFSVTLGGQMTW